MTDPLLDEVTAPGAGSLAAVARELIGPYADALTPRPLPFTGGPGDPGVTVPTGTRWPLVLLTLLADLDGTTVTAVPHMAAPGTDQPPVVFAPWSQAGSSLTAFVPATDDAGTAAAFGLTITARRTAPDGTVTAVATADLPGLLRVDLVQGMAGRLMTALLAEKARVRRCGREIAAMRALAVARDDALDRLGGDLGCSRFADDLVWDPTRRSPTTAPLTPAGRREDDASYRSRLTLLRGLRLPTPGWAESLLIGDPPGTGSMADVGFTGPIAVDENPNVVNLALRLVAPGLTHGRATLLDAIRRVHLFWPAGSAAGDAAHAQRMLPAAVAARDAGTRAALARWHLPPTQPVAPALARALEALDARCTLLGARPWPSVAAGQSDAGGSRFELGHGASLAAVDPAALDKAVAAANARHDPGLVPVPRSADPVGAWLLTACGMRTAEPVADGTVFVSVLPMGPLVVDLAPAAEGPLPITATARLVTTADTAHDAPLTAVVALLAAQHLTPVADVAGLIAGIQVPTVAPAVVQAMGVLGVPLATDLAGFRRQLATVSARQYVAIDLGTAGTAAAAANPKPLGDTLTAAGNAGASSVVGLITATGTLALLLGITGLPLAGSNLAARQTVLYRWQVRGLAGDGVLIDPRRGAGTQIYAAGDGISVLSCVAHVRGRGNDPYEWSPAPAGGALLTLRQYEHLMNIVELATPVGVRANTWRLRQEHVDVDGSGKAFPLTAAAARTYRRYRAGR